MPNQHKTKSVNWHPSDPALKPWLEAEAMRRGVPVRVILDEMAAEYRTQRVRDLSGYEVVHKDGDIRNNDTSNIELRERKQQ
jgi:hypothetical protein